MASSRSVAGGTGSISHNLTATWDATGGDNADSVTVRGFTFRSPHGPFWRNSTHAEMIDSGRVVTGDPEGSNLLNRIALARRKQAACRRRDRGSLPNAWRMCATGSRAERPTAIRRAWSA
jgi:hypothetical protein